MSADPRPVSAQVLEQAIAWQLSLDAGRDRPRPAALQRWLDADPEHARAWAQLAAIDQRLGAAAEPLARRALQQAGSARRRRTRGGLLGLVLLASLGLGLVQQYRPLPDWLADEATGAGIQRSLLLPDRSRIRLNSRSALDVQFDGQQRRLFLRHGEILVETAPDPDPRPFIVATEQGTLRALGTRFLVRREGDHTRLIVLRSAVAAQPIASAAQRTINAGEQVLLRSDRLGPSEAAPVAADAWSHGMLVVEDMPLGELLARLGEYRRGYLGLDPSLADLRISGSFPLHDTDRALDALPPSLPVRIERHTDWWVRVLPARN